MVASVKHISILCMKEDREKLVKALQKCGEVMLEDTETSVRTPSTGDTLRRIEKLRTDIKPFAPKKSLFEELPSIGIEEFENVSSASVEKAEEMERIISEISSNESEIKDAKSLIDELKPWDSLKADIRTVSGETANAVIIPGFIPSSSLEKAIKAVNENGIGLDIIKDDGKNTYVVVTYFKGDSISPISALGFERVTLPNVSGIPCEIIQTLATKCRSREEDNERLKQKLSSLASTGHTADILYEQFKAASECESVPATETEEAILLEGWVPEDRLWKAEKAIKKAVSVCDIETRDPIEGEEAPTVLKNNKIVTQFEGVTNMFSVPKAGGIDPNPVMSPWYWIIFGLMMGDVGYGAMMLVLGLGYKFIMKPKGGMAQIINIITMSSVTTMIAGVLFGSYFGEELLPAVLFTSMDEPVKMLIFTLVVGVLHIFTGLIVAIVQNIKQGHVFDAIADQLSWILVIGGLGVMCLKFVNDVFFVPGIIVACVGALIVVCTAGRAKPSLFGKVSGGLVGLYGVTGYLSDILSYSRILALGLSTGVVGMVMNILAGMVMDGVPVLGYVFAILIYVVGHVFNLVLGLLSAYIHDSRLQYIEFYGKFYEGNGKLFKPFKADTKTITIKNNLEEN